MREARSTREALHTDDSAILPRKEHRELDGELEEKKGGEM